MKIKEQIITKIKSIRDFALADAGENDIGEFKEKALFFLNAKTYGDASDKAESLMNFALDIHGKTEAMGPIITSMKNFELNGRYSYEKQRTHYLHSTNNYLLGLYLYHGCSIIKKAIHNEMRRTSEKKKIRYKGEVSNWQYSGGSVEGEFFYRWRLCSLCHDIGYPISLSTNEKDINTYLLESGINNLNNLKCRKLLPNNEALLEAFLDLKTYMDEKENNPGPGKEKYDHGIMGGLIFFYKMDKLFLEKPTVEYKNGGKIIWDRVVFNTSLKEVANAVAMHNLEMHEAALKKSLLKPFDCKIFDIDKNALSWLLKVTDMLQEWDKPKALDYDEKKHIPEQDIEIEMTPEEIIVTGFDSDTKNKINEKLEKYFKRPEILKLL